MAQFHFVDIVFADSHTVVWMIGSGGLQLSSVNFVFEIPHISDREDKISAKEGKCVGVKS